jgi:hypothetical protein
MFGDNSIALRLPMLIGFLIMSLALFKFVSTRLPPVYGAIASVFPFVTSAQFFLHEARSYGLELGFAALALLCWQHATQRKNRSVALGGLWLSLAAAISCHYYGFLLILPLATGEIVRSICQKQVDVAIWTCLAGSLLTLVPTLPLLLSIAKHVGVFWAQPHWGDLKYFYINLLTDSVPLILAALIFAIIIPNFFRSEATASDSCSNSTFPDYEIAAILGFFALPIFGMLVAQFATKSFSDRYFISAVLGISVVFADGLYRLLDGRIRAATGFMLLLFVYAIQLEIHEIRVANNDRRKLEQSITFLRSNNLKGAPIVVGDPHTFVVLSHYAPADVRSHLIYLSNPALAGRFLGFTSVENVMVYLVGPWFHLNVIPLEQFLVSKPKFLLYGGWSFNWVYQALVERRFRFEFLGAVEVPEFDRNLFSVTPP